MEDQELKPFYVYELRDPLDDSVFYVGKGQNGRAESHEKNVSNGTDNTQEKLNKIAEINARTNPALNEVRTIVVGRYESEEEAFAVEATLIKWVYGKETLTNNKHGHHHESIRERGNYNEIEGISIEKTDRSTDGSFTNDIKEKNERYKVNDKLERLKSKLKEKYPAWNISELTEPEYDKSFYIHYNDYIKIQCLLRGNEQDSLIVNIRPLINNENQRAIFDDVGEALNVQIRKNEKNPNPYSKLDGWKGNEPKIQDIDTITERLQEAWQALDSVDFDQFLASSNK